MGSNKNKKRIGLVLFFCLFLGCGSYPEVTSRESLELIKQVYTACNTRDVKRLEECEKQLEKLRLSGKMGAKEVNAFRKSLDLAKNGNWEEAQNQALKFAQDQIR